MKDLLGIWGGGSSDTATETKNITQLENDYTNWLQPNDIMADAKTNETVDEWWTPDHVHAILQEAKTKGMDADGKVVTSWWRQDYLANTKIWRKAYKEIYGNEALLLVNPPPQNNHSTNPTQQGKPSTKEEKEKEEEEKEEEWRKRSEKSGMMVEETPSVKEIFLVETLDWETGGERTEGAKEAVKIINGIGWQSEMDLVGWLVSGRGGHTHIRGQPKRIPLRLLLP
ncbi:hypothetical protein [Aerosakkonema funiforme]|uniref:hypothetical protein n=1 Tax=Aerosakkonema funiforme TaxID=1246630 RepID=UPI0035B8BA2B